MQEKVYTKAEVRSLKRGASVYPPVIAKFLHGRRMIFHDAQGGSILVADDVTAEDSVCIWVHKQTSDPARFDGEAQFKIEGNAATYTVTLRNQQWSCTCSGYGFRRKCRHIEIAKTKLA